jgi:hypothetical protein
MQSWLDLIAMSGKDQKLIVLCDNQGSVPTEIGALRASRTNFLSLSAKLTGQTNPLVVIAWGHGGRQGSEPVFHVRGPRITAEDFKSVAAQIPAVQSRWILMFRGSGSFARRLAAAERQILSSDFETQFSSDPVGMPVLQKLVRAKPSISFETLCTEFGHSTAAWYEDQNLARTEEPTVWLATQKPLLLASAAEAPSAASAKSVEPEKPLAPTAAEPTVQSNQLPEVWKNIKRAAPRDYPGADAIILRRRLNYTLGSSPAIAAEREEFVQILTSEGKRFGDFDISYSPPFEDINILDCEVLHTNGQLARLDPDAIREAREETVGDYQAGRRKFFSLPGVAPGAVLHVRYRTQWKEFPMPNISLQIPIERELPSVDSTLTVSIPKNSSFHFVFENPSSTERSSPVPDPVLSQTDYGATYSWHLGPLPADVRESLISPGERTRLLLSTFPDWPAFDDWYRRISKMADEVTPEIAAKAAELARDCKSQRDKVVAIYNYVTRMRYVAVPLGINSFRPHAAANVLQNQFGDCKDKANLFNTLLGSLKIDASLVLVPRFSQAYQELPGFAFNHAISRVMIESQTLWIDTTDDVCRFGMLPPGDAGRKVLVVNSDEPGLTQLPQPEPANHKLKLRGEISCTNGVEAWPVILNATAIGFPDYELRETGRASEHGRAGLPLLAARFRPASGALALEKQTATSVAALDEDFSWRGEGFLVGLGSSEAGKKLLHAPVWLPKEWDLALHHRSAALFLNQGYPLTLEEEFEFVLSEKAQMGDLPEVRENKSPPLLWRLEWAKVGHDKLATRFRAELVHGELSASETPLFQSQLRSLMNALAACATILVPP